jgi:hypothetical protein
MDSLEKNFKETVNMKPKMVPLPNRIALDFKHTSSRADTSTITKHKIGMVQGKGCLASSVPSSSETLLWTNHNETSCGELNCMRARKEIDMLVQQLSHTEEVYEMLYDKTQAENAQKEAHLAQLSKTVSSLQKRLKSLKVTTQPHQAVTTTPTRKSYSSQQDMSDKQVQVCIKDRNENSESGVSEAACEREEMLSSQVLALESELVEKRKRLTRINYEVERLERDVETWKSVAHSAQEAVVASRTEMLQLKSELESKHDPTKISNIRLDPQIASVAVQTVEMLDSLVQDKQVKDSSTQAVYEKHTDLKSNVEYNAAVSSLCADLNALAAQLLSECKTLGASHSMPSTRSLVISQQVSLLDNASLDTEHGVEERNEDNLDNMRLHAQKLEEQLHGLAQVNR